MCWSCEVGIVSGENQHVDLNTNVLNVLVFLGGPLARTKKSLKNLFLEKIIIPAQKSIPFNVIKEVQ